MFRDLLKRFGARVISPGSPLPIAWFRIAVASFCFLHTFVVRNYFLELYGQYGYVQWAITRAHLYNGLTQVLQGYVEVGTKEIQEAVKLDPNNVRGRLLLGEVYLQSGAPAAAENEAVEVLRRHPSNVQAGVLYGDSFLARKDWKKAEAQFTDATRADGSNTEYLFYRALALFQSGDRPGALKTLEAKLPDDPRTAVLRTAVALGQSPGQGATELTNMLFKKRFATE